MHKKLITACVALFALAAIALPAAAQATNNPVITHPTGTVLNPTGKTCTAGLAGICIKATNVGNTLLTETNNTSNVFVTCTSAEMTGALQTNTTGNVAGEIHSAKFTGTGAGGACIGTFGSNSTVDVLGLPWCLKANATMATDTWRITGGKCSEAAKKTEFKLTTSLGECVYRSTTTTIASGFFTTHPTEAELTTNGEAHPSNGYEKIVDKTPFSICPSSGELSMTFTLETDTATAEPLYISS